MPCSLTKFSSARYLNQGHQSQNSDINTFKMMPDAYLDARIIFWFCFDKTSESFLRKVFKFINKLTCSYNLVRGHWVLKFSKSQIMICYNFSWTTGKSCFYSGSSQIFLSLFISINITNTGNGIRFKTTDTKINTQFQSEY